MDDNELHNLHDVLLIIMKEIDRVCDANNIKYSLWAGTLIGAVRHKGFIPWDDDLDIAMPRRDYEYFLKIAKTEMKSQFRIITILNTKNYGYGFAKVTLKHTKIEQLGTKNGKDLEIWVDIFPYDNIPNSKFKRCIQNNVNYFLMKLLEEKFDGIYGESGVLKKLCFVIFHILNYFINVNKVKFLLDKNMRRYEKENTNNISCISSPYGYKKEILPNAFFDDIVEYEFEGIKFKGFEKYDYYLSQVYGNYMLLPPEGKRHIHNLIVHDFGPRCLEDNIEESI